MGPTHADFAAAHNGRQAWVAPDDTAFRAAPPVSRIANDHFGCPPNPDARRISRPETSVPGTRGVAPGQPAGTRDDTVPSPAQPSQRRLVLVAVRSGRRARATAMTTQSAAPARWQPSPLILGSVGVHIGAAAALMIAPGQWPSAAGTIIANHLLITAAGLWPRSRLLGPNLLRLPPAAAAAQ